jgi:hypothetical protein
MTKAHAEPWLRPGDVGIGSLCTWEKEYGTAVMTFVEMTTIVCRRKLYCQDGEERESCCARKLLYSKLRR